MNTDQYELSVIVGKRARSARSHASGAGGAACGGGDMTAQVRCELRARLEQGINKVRSPSEYLQMYFPLVLWKKITFCKYPVAWYFSKGVFPKNQG